MSSLEKYLIIAAAGYAAYRLAAELTPGDQVGKVPNFIVWGGGGLLVAAALGAKEGLAFSAGGYAAAAVLSFT